MLDYDYFLLFHNIYFYSFFFGAFLHQICFAQSGIARNLFLALYDEQKKNSDCD